MSIRLPLTTVLDVTNTDLGTTSVAGGYAYPFKIPQDTDNIVVKFMPSVLVGNASAYLQTSDDGGTTYYDVARTSVLTLANAANAQWLSVSTFSPGQRTAVTQASSVIVAGIGSAAASTLGSQQVSGLPILGLQNRIFMTIGSGVTQNDGCRIQVKVNNQSATA
jgi:hypothetical protein